MYRQGDVLIVPVDEVPPHLKPVPAENGLAILAHGEAPGHRHAIADPRVSLFGGPPGLFMQVLGDAPVALEHAEHATIAVPPGNYRIVRQREYQPGLALSRMVCD